MALTVAGSLTAAGAVGYHWNRLPSAAPTAHAGVMERTQAALPDFGALVERNGPAVVNISVKQSPKATDSAMSLDGDPFGGFLRRFGAPAPERNAPTLGQGSGFIISADGLVLTNAHVVNGASEVTVKLTDRREFVAKVIGKDVQSDVALLRIDANNLPTVTLGDPRALRAGEWVVAIGSPFGFENSVTAGIVSAKGRTLPDESYVPFIQTDVAVNPGNSGGPLFNLAGEVVGINSQIFSHTGGYQGLSFAIPIDVAINVKDQLAERGRVTRGYLGVTVQQLNQQLADSFALKKPEGALVSSIVPDGPAAKAGLEPGDVILGVDDKAISISSELPVRVSAMKPGARAKLEVWRKGTIRQIEVLVGELQPPPQLARADAPAEAEGRLGLAVRPLTPDERAAANAKAGLLVEQASGPAAQAGILPGDVILSLNGTPMSSPTQLRARLARSGKHVALLVQRGDSKIFIPVTLG
jgi:serine protease Do